MVRSEGLNPSLKKSRKKSTGTVKVNKHIKLKGQKHFFKSLKQSQKQVNKKSDLGKLTFFDFL